MLMYGREAPTKTRQGQPPRRYSEQEGEHFLCNFFVNSVDFTPDNRYNTYCLSEDLQSKKIVEVG